VFVSRVRVDIDRLVLKGFDPADRYALTQGLETELARILAASMRRGDPARSHRTPVMRLGRVALEPGAAGNRRLGQSIAQAIGGKLKP
jgi:hypothetical protein